MRGLIGSADEPVFASEILASLGLHDHLIRTNHEGVANATYIGQQFVVRINKNEEYLSDTCTEVVAAPAAHRAGIMTPSLLGYQTERTAWTVFDRVPGVRASSVPLKDSFFIELGREIGRIHSRVSACPDPNGWLDPVEPWDPTGPIGANEGMLPNTLEWLAVVSRLVDCGGVPERVSFVHQDLHLDNVMATSDGAHLTGIIDWGDAGFGDPAIEFGNLPIDKWELLFEGYGPVGLSFLARALCESVAKAHARLAEGHHEPLTRLTHWINTRSPEALQLRGLVTQVCS